MVVREARADDLPLLWALIEARSDHDYAAFAVRAEDKMRSGDHCIAVAVLGTEVVGYAWAQDYGPHLRDGERTARFHDLIVAEHARHRGIGRQLFELVRSWAERRGIRWLQWQSSPAAVGFYERLGLKGDPCPQPDHPFFEIEFPRRRA